MSNTTKPVSFRLPSKYVVFLDYMAAEHQSNRTEVLTKMLDIYLTNYLRSVSQPPAVGGGNRASQ